MFIDVHPPKHGGLRRGFDPFPKIYHCCGCPVLWSAAKPWPISIRPRSSSIWLKSISRLRWGPPFLAGIQPSHPAIAPHPPTLALEPKGFGSRVYSPRCRKVSCASAMLNRISLFCLVGSFLLRDTPMYSSMNLWLASTLGIQIRGSFLLWTLGIWYHKIGFITITRVWFFHPCPYDVFLLAVYQSSRCYLCIYICIYTSHSIFNIT